MIPYFGRHSCKQFLRGKPVRFGFKAWCLNNPAGYCLAFDIYQGQNPTGNPQYGIQFGKSASALLDLIDTLPPRLKNLPFHFYMDNLFTGLPLLQYLSKNNYRATGTIRQNRVPNDCPITSVAVMKKADRGKHSVTSERNNNIVLVRWKDNAVVTAASTLTGTGPMKNVRRWSAKDRKHIFVPQPAVFHQYNQYMGGTDRMDQNIGNYRIGIRTKKWWWSIFIWHLGMAMQNSWILYKQAHPDFPQLDFIRQIVQTYVARATPSNKSMGRPAAVAKTSLRVLDDVRFDGRDHLVINRNSQGTCANKNRCKSFPKTGCNKCNVPLCVKCFVDFHTK